MTTTYLAGHGEWKLSDGYATVPKDCSISFYTEFSKNMFTADMKAIIGGTFGGSVKLKVEGFKTCPNYTLSGDPVSLVECQNLLAGRNDANLRLIMFGAGEFKLSELFKIVGDRKVVTDFVWCACRYTGLKDVGGKRIGVNGAQGTFGDRDGLGNLIGMGQSPDNYYFNPTNQLIKNL